MSQKNVMQKSFWVNSGLVIIKIVSGIIFNSAALLADGIHSISDLLSDIFVILGLNHSHKPADDEHPFGHGKFEYILSLFLGVSILIVAYNLGKEVIATWNDVHLIPKTVTLFIVLGVIIIKYVLATYLLKKGKLFDSEVISASGSESFSDVLSSFVVLIGILSVILGNAWTIRWMMNGDKIAAIFIVLFILRIGIKIIYQAIISLQGRSISKDKSIQYLELIKQIEGVIEVDNLVLVAYGPYYQAIVDIQVDGNISVKEGHDIAENVERQLRSNEKICHVSIHVNPGER
jgi:cation diffusion facilitator family transporter